VVDHFVDLVFSESWVDLHGTRASQLIIQQHLQLKLISRSLRSLPGLLSPALGHGQVCFLRLEDVQRVFIRPFCLHGLRPVATCLVRQVDLDVELILVEVLRSALEMSCCCWLLDSRRPLLAIEVLDDVHEVPLTCRKMLVLELFGVGGTRFLEA